MIKELGKFQLIKKIASGGMAEIHLAKQTGVAGFEKIVVIKTILPDLASNKEFTKMFLDEARIAARLTHPNIGQIYDLGQADATYFIAMEYIQGENLRTIANRCRKTQTLLPLEHVAKIVSHACEGLHYAHTKIDTLGRPMNIVHRDVSPQNILVSFEGAVKLVDFGIAKAANLYQDNRPGVLKGKYSYMSPEQCLGQLVDYRSDIFSLGIILWEMATGLRLFRLNSELEILKAITRGKIKPPSEINQRVPADLEYIILRALEKKPEDRFGNAVEMHLTLEKFLKNQQLTSGSVQLAAFMREMFSDKLESLRIIEQPDQNEALGAILFDDISEDEMYIPGTGMTPSSASQATDPSKPLFPMSTTGISRIEGQPVTNLKRPSKRRFLIGSLIVLLLGILGTAGYFHFRKSGDKPVVDKTKPVAKPAMGAIRISSTPSGATVIIDGNKRGTSPCDVKDLELGRSYKMILSKAGQRPWKTEFKLKDSSVREFKAKLKRSTVKAWGTVEIVTHPSGAKVTLNGIPLDKLTPLTIKKVAAKTDQNLVVTLEGHQDWVKTFKVRPGQRLKLRGILPVSDSVASVKKEQAYITLKSKPTGAEFFLNGSPIGGSFSLAPGSDYLVSAKLKGYQEWRETIKPTAGEKKVITANLVRKADTSVVASDKARLSLNSTPPAEVFVDKVNIGTTPIANHEISTGEHIIHLVNFKIKAREILRITAKPGESIEKNVQFAKGFLDISAVPGTNVFVHGKQIGTTPFKPKEKYAGTYKVLMKNPVLNVSVEKTAVIKEGKTTTLKAGFVE
jgi:eukaryotic-like serine/threonine-protein kinase